MKGLPKFIGRGLLVLALGSCAFACGDDDGGSKPKPDAGGEAGSSGEAGSGDVDAGGGASEACVECGCTNGYDELVACNADAMCWALISCFQTNCSDLADPTDMTMRTNCAVSNCADSIGGAATATPAGAVLTASCATECAPTSGGDGGTDTDAGN